jgi:heat shock protein HslJ
MKLITFLSAGVFIVLSAILMKKENTVQTTSLYETKWSLKKIHAETETEVATKAFIKFNQEKNSAGGNGSCNSFGSNTTIKDKEISFSNIFSTKMYCEEVQQIENAFLNNLGKATRFELKDKTLLIYQDKALLLEFVAE